MEQWTGVAGQWGVCVLAHEGIGRRRGKLIEDERGWGRMGGMMVHGKGGKAVAVMQVYYPCEGKPDGDAGRMFNRQQQGLRQEVRRGRGLIQGVC